MTTCGYGDVHANTVTESIFSILVILFGQVLFGVLLAVIAATMVFNFIDNYNYSNLVKLVYIYIYVCVCVCVWCVCVCVIVL